MDYEQLSEKILKPTEQWSTDDVETWLNYICMSNLIPNFTQHKIDGSCLQILDQNDLEAELIIKSKIARKKIMKWIEFGFEEFNVYLKSRTADLEMKDCPQLPRMERNSTSMLRDWIKPENRRERDSLAYDNSEMIITAYEGPHANFYTINQPVNTIGRLHKNTIVVLEESAAKLHAEIRILNRKFYITDIGTNSGTFIKVFEKQLLKVGMIIEMGSFQFTVRDICIKSRTIFLRSLHTILDEDNELIITLSQAGKKIHSFGRKMVNDFCYDDQHLSGIHAKIHFLDGSFILEDMSSTNGTWIRVGAVRTRSEPFQLYHGCVFKIGTTSTYICKMKNVMQPKASKPPPLQCGVCHENGTDCVFVPCKHNTACYQCSHMLEFCTVCGLAIQEKIKIFI